MQNIYALIWMKFHSEAEETENAMNAHNQVKKVFTWSLAPINGSPVFMSRNCDKIRYNLLIYILKSSKFNTSHASDWITYYEV